MTCRHCGKRIRSFNDYRGETAWTHEDQMIGRWCWLEMAEPEQTEDNRSNDLEAS